MTPTLQELIEQLNLKLLTEPKGMFRRIRPASGYASDLLSCVMAGAKHASLWVTLQAHLNIVAVAALLEISAVIITEGAVPDQTVIDRANEQGVTLLSTEATTFAVVGKLWELGIREG
jgi:serine kinase of HPr protein (carbohydrate metabolism regulator)